MLRFNPGHKDIRDQLAEQEKKVGILSGIGVFAESYSSLQAAITAIGSQKKTMIISKATTISANTTIPSNVTMRFIYPAKLIINSGVVLTINGAIEAGYYQIFQFADATSQVTTANPSTWNTSGSQTNAHYKIKVDWFGAFPDAVPPNNFASNYNTLPTGTDSSDGFRRAFKFALDASIKTFDVVISNPKVTVAASPNGCYYVQGHNLMGVQDINVKGVCIDFEGNGAQILHRVLTSTDALIGNACKLYKPSYQNFSVNVYNTDSQSRIGSFLDVNGSGVTDFYFYASSFSKLRIGQPNLGRGYTDIFKINGSKLADTGHVSNSYFGSFTNLFNVMNPEAVGWKFEKCYIAPTTTNARMFSFDCAFSGSFTADACEFLIENDGEQILRTRTGTNTTSKFRIINCRLESRKVTNTTFFDLDFGHLYAEGLVYMNGFGIGTEPTTKRTARIGGSAKVELVDCYFPEDFDYIATGNGVSANGLYTGLILRSTNLYELNGSKTSSYPKLHVINNVGAEVSMKTALSSGYTIKKVIVENPKYNEGNGLLEWEMQSGYSAIKRVTMSSLYNGSPRATPQYIRIPHYSVITSIKLYCATVDTAVVDTYNLLFLNSGGGVAGTLDFTLDGTRKDGVEILPVNKQYTLSNSYIILFAQFKKGTTAVTDQSVTPKSWIEVTYRGVAHSTDYGATENAIQYVDVI